MKFQKVFAFVFTLSVALVMAGCHHQTPVAKVNTPPPAVTAPSPTAELRVTPATVENGQSAKLSWQTQNATAINIDGVGTVAASGSMNITPPDSTTYHLTATGNGGSTDASARITVNASTTTVSKITDEQLFAQNVKDIFFSYDNYQISSDQEAALNADAEFLAQHPNMKLVIEGHCDERGSEDYNMGLGDNRANIVRDILAKHGVTGDRVHTISYGKERPFCTKSEDESCFKENRRAHFVLQKQQVASN